jgi:hypothetical protein
MEKNCNNTRKSRVNQVSNQHQKQKPCVNCNNKQQQQKGIQKAQQKRNQTQKTNKTIQKCLFYSMNHGTTTTTTTAKTNINGYDEFNKL